jgi:L,D-peptidoglycan transpeptidase YkuD (ErfK/YbiS/YcfS/YnhG family)
VTRADLVVTPKGVRFMGRLFPARLGRGGITAAKREGDGATPVGVHRFIGLLYRPERVARADLPGWARPIGLRQLWCDDPDHADYNLPVTAPFPASHERLRRVDPQYDLVLLTDWNWPEARPGRGSAIFVHIRRGPGHPTAGCVALRRDHLIWIARRIRPHSRLVVPGVMARK